MVGQPESARFTEAKRLVLEYPDTPTRTLAKRLAAEFKCSIEAARVQLRTLRGAKGKRPANQAIVKRAKGKAGWKPEMPPSLSDEWTPFILDTGRVGIISDVHIPYHAETAFGAAVAYLKKQRIDCLLINGDLADFYTISRFQKDPRKRDMRTEVSLVRQGLAWLRSQFTSARIVWKLGNHEERWQHFLWNHAPEICDLEQVQLDRVCDVERYGVEIVDDQRPVVCGDLPILHGHELPRGISSPVNAARGAFMRTMHTVAVGHLHRTSTHSEPDMWGAETVCWSFGCLCDMRPEYARFNKWNWGFGLADVASSGTFDLENLRIAADGSIRAS